MRNDPQIGRGQGHVTYFLNFGTSDSITFKRMKLVPSFFLCWIGHGKGDSPLSQRATIAKVRYRKCRYCHVMYNLLYPSIRVRTAPPVSVRVRTRVSVSFSFTVLQDGVPRTFAIADLNHGKYYIRDDEWPQRGRGQGHMSYFWSNGTDTHVPQNVFLVFVTFLL